MGFWEYVFGIKPGSKSPVDVKKEVAGVCLGNFVGDAPITGPVLTIIDGIGSGIELSKFVKCRIGQYNNSYCFFLL